MRCNNCLKEFSGGAARIADHTTGMGATKACTCDTDAFLDLKQNIIDGKNEKTHKKQQKTAAADVDAASDVKPRTGEMMSWGDSSMHTACLSRQH